MIMTVILSMGQRHHDNSDRQPRSGTVPIIHNRFYHQLQVLAPRAELRTLSVLVERLSATLLASYRHNHDSKGKT
jgi:hypothetical protein